MDAPTSAELMADRQRRQATLRRTYQEEWARRQEELARLEREEAPLRPGPAVIPSVPALPPPRDPGAPVALPSRGGLLALDAEEHFDLEALNGLDLADLAGLGLEDPAGAREVHRKVSELLPRVRQECAAPELMAGFLRRCVTTWWAQGEDEGPPDPRRWAGLYAPSGVAGGPRRSPLLVRLRGLEAISHGRGSWGGRLRQALPIRSHPDAPPSLSAEVTQALLDDLSSLRRSPAGDVRLDHLGELAQRRGAAAVTPALFQLLGGDPRGPFPLREADPREGAGEILLRPPAFVRNGRPTYRLRWGDPPSPGFTGSPGAPGPEDLEGRILALWSELEPGPEAWTSLLASAHRLRHRLPSPPREARSTAAYENLRGRLIHDPEARADFLAVRWRGKPAGLGHLAQLLKEGHWEPVAGTDHEYLEAELEALGAGETLPDGARRWRAGPWEVHRHGSFGRGFTYAATPSGPGSGLPSGA